MCSRRAAPPWSARCIFLQKLRISPDAAFSVNDWTAFVIFITVIGGIGRIEGPIVGTIVFFVLRQTLADQGTLYLLMLGAVAIVVMLKAPKGIWGVIVEKLDWQIFPLQRRVVVVPQPERMSLSEKEQRMSPAAPKKSSIAIDIHAHMMLPRGLCRDGRSQRVRQSRRTIPRSSPEARKKAKERSDFVCAKMATPASASARWTRWASTSRCSPRASSTNAPIGPTPDESLRLERMLNDRIAEMVATNPKRLIGLGSVPLHAPELAAREVERCMTRAQAASGFNISTMARDMEIGDRRLWPFWEKAAEHDAIVYIHPAGNPSPRFQKHFLWNSVGTEFRGGDGDRLADVRGRARRLPEPQDLHLARRRLHAAVHGPHRPQLPREADAPAPT